MLIIRYFKKVHFLDKGPYTNITFEKTVHPPGNRDYGAASDPAISFPREGPDQPTDLQVEQGQ